MDKSKIWLQQGFLKDTTGYVIDDWYIPITREVYTGHVYTFIYKLK